MSESISFDQLNLPAPLLSAVKALGYEYPTPVQEKSIPILIGGHDMIAQAQTGTGKTAAFALPTLANIDADINSPQVLVIAPTRELAIQVAEAYQSYAKNLKGFHVAPIYGGQDYKLQLKVLKRGAQVIVGTPGRVMDHLRRETIKTEHLKTIVLDEADEMLKMGFIEDIEWILEQLPEERQTALFSATMPRPIQEIAKRYLSEPKKVHIKEKQQTVAKIKQFYCRVYREHKLDALTRFLEVEKTDAVIIFSKTKILSEELATKLQARGYDAAALNGDMKQSHRQQVLKKIKSGVIDIIVATDVAARGIDVERVTHVFNYDIPFDAEAYVHRIGRTGRAGREGCAISFITPREQRMLRDIEHITKSRMDELTVPTVAELQASRSENLVDGIVELIRGDADLAPSTDIVKMIAQRANCSPRDIAAALLYQSQAANPIPTEDLKPIEKKKSKPKRRPGEHKRSNGDKKRPYKGKGRGNDERPSRGKDDRPPRRKKPKRKD